MEGSTRTFGGEFEFTSEEFQKKTFETKNWSKLEVSSNQGGLWLTESKTEGTEKTEFIWKPEFILIGKNFWARTGPNSRWIRTVAAYDSLSQRPRNWKDAVYN